MTSKVYANENDPNAAHWLSCIPIHINCVDERSIRDVSEKDLNGFTQCHFFAGIGGWPLAFEMAGWPTDVSVWSGSCPCQPFSAAGKRKGTADERHLWPEFLRLIAECKPPTIFGEQVASKAGRDWLATVRTDLEALGYAVGAADLCAASVGAPHIRQRLFWVADRTSREQWRAWQSGQGDGPRQLPTRRHGTDSGMADTTSKRGRGWAADTRESAGRASVEIGSGMGNTASERCGETRQSESYTRPTDVLAHSGWSDAEYIPCRDGKARPVKPGIRCLAHGVPGRVAQLRGLGNAILPALAATFIAAFMESVGIEK